MTERLTPKLEEIYHLIESDAYDEAMERIAELESPDRDDAIVFLYKALCIYERGDDLECMRLLVSFIGAVPPRHPKLKYALFTFAVCLQNQDLDDDALSILRSLPSTYPDLDAAIASSERALSSRRSAQEILESLRRCR